MIHARQHLVPGTVSDFSLGPTGKRVLLESRGQLFTAPAESGDIREIGNQLGSRSKDSSWSPDGKPIAYISDRSGEENIWITPAAGDGEPKQLTHESKVMLMSLIWSPDSKLMLYRDFAQNLKLLDVTTCKVIKVDFSPFDSISDYSAGQGLR